MTKTLNNLQRKIDVVKLTFASISLLVHGQVTIIFVVSVGLPVCWFVCAEYFSAVFDPISIKLGHICYVSGSSCVP